MKIKVLTFLIAVILAVASLALTTCDTGNSTTIVSDTSTVPGQTATFTAVAGDKQVVLAWTAPADNGGSEITGYEVTRDNWANKVTKTAANLTHTYTGLTNGTSYTFKVRAVNAKGSGAEKTATATPTAGITPGGTVVTNWEGLTVESGTKGTQLTTFQNRSNVLHVTPTSGDGDYDWRILSYNLDSYAGQVITINLSVDVWLDTLAKIAWQVSGDPWPLIAGGWSNVTSGSWQTISGSNTITVPNGESLYLSGGGGQNPNTPVYFNNLVLNITTSAGTVVTNWEGLTVESGTKGTQLTTFQNRSNVLHVTPTSGDGDYDWRILSYNLDSYAGQVITINLYVDVWLDTPAKIAWQVSGDPWPLIAGGWSNVTSGSWQTISGSNTITVPGGESLYLSGGGGQNPNTPVYFNNLVLNITTVDKIPVNLDVPALTINTGTKTASWTSVLNANNGYTIKIGTTETPVTAGVNSYDLSSLAAGTHQISVKTNGYETSTHIYIGSAYCAEQSYTVSGTSTYTVSGIIVSYSPNGLSPISGATVQLKSGSTNIGSTVTTNARGEYTITGVPNGTYTIEVSKSGYTTGTIAAFTVSDANVTVAYLQLNLDPNTYTISGTITSDNPGGPLSSATVQLKSGSTNIGSAVTTNASGEYTITGVPNGTYTIEVSKSGYTTGTITAFTVDGADLAGKNLQLNFVGYTVSGTITSNNPGGPLSGASVQLKNGGSNVGSAVNTNASGAYSITGVPNGTYTIEVSKDGYTTGTIEAFTVSGNLTGKNLQLNILTYTVSGTITSDNPGGVLSGARVQLKRDGTNIGSPVTTNAYGNYSITGVPNGTYTIEVSKDGYTTGTIAAFTVSGVNVMGKNLTLNLIPTYTVSGTITSDYPGGALSGASVQLKISGTNVGSSVTTNASGAYTITGVPSGTYWIEVSRTGYTTGTITPLTVSGADVTGKNLQLIRICTVSGTITSDNPGGALSGANVQLKRDGSNVGYLLTTDANGTYTITIVQSGTYTIEVSKTGYTTGTIPEFTVAGVDVTGKNLQLNIVTYTVTFNSNGGSSITSQNVTEGGKVTEPPAPTKTGYDCIFAGWYKEASLTNRWYFASDTVTANITLYAKWTAYAVGSTGPGGGTIFYHDPAGFTVQMVNPAKNYIAHYLEAAPVDIKNVWWADRSDDVTGTSQSIGTGRKNTAIIIDHGEANGYITPAASVCATLTQGGKSDWFLPSYEEMNALLRYTPIIINYDITYWSSSQHDILSAYIFLRRSGLIYSGFLVKTANEINCGVRPVRAF